MSVKIPTLDTRPQTLHAVMASNIGKAQFQSTSLKTSRGATNLSFRTLCFMLSFASSGKRYFTSLILASHGRKRASRAVRAKLFQLNYFSAATLCEFAANFQLVDDISEEWKGRFQVVTPYLLSAVRTRVFCVQPSWDARRAKNMAAGRFNRVFQNTGANGTYELRINIREPFQIDSHGHRRIFVGNLAIRPLRLPSQHWPSFIFSFPPVSR